MVPHPRTGPAARRGIARLVAGSELAAVHNWAKGSSLPHLDRVAGAVGEGGVPKFCLLAASFARVATRRPLPLPSRGTHSHFET